MDPLQRAIERHKRKEADRAYRRRGYRPCEVVVNKGKGPHRCDRRGVNIVNGHYVCNTHAHLLDPRFLVFTPEEAMAIAREHRAKDALDIRGDVA